MNLVVIDGQGGRMGSQIIEGVRAAGFACDITAIGTNVLATSAMLKAGADRGATGENPVVVACRDAQVIVGPIGILAADSLLGEVTPAMAVAVGQSRAVKLLLPVNQCRNLVVGTQQLTLSQLVAQAVAQLRQMSEKDSQPPAKPVLYIPNPNVAIDHNRENGQPLGVSASPDGQAARSLSQSRHEGVLPAPGGKESEKERKNP